MNHFGLHTVLSFIDGTETDIELKSIAESLVHGLTLHTGESGEDMVLKGLDGYTIKAPSPSSYIPVKDNTWYHGSPKKFSSFKGENNFLTSDPWIAAQFAIMWHQKHWEGHEFYLYECSVEYSNPYVIDKKGMLTLNDEPVPIRKADEPNDYAAEYIQKRSNHDAVLWKRAKDATRHASDIIHVLDPSQITIEKVHPFDVKK